MTPSITLVVLTLVVLVFSFSLVTSEALKCKVGTRATLISTQTCLVAGMKCGVIATNKDGKNEISYGCQPSVQCDRSNEHVKNCCCDSDDCNDESFGRKCSFAAGLKYWPLVSFASAFMVYILIN